MLDFTLENDIARITLNRPDKLNSMTGEMLQQLAGALERCVDARVMVLTGAGRAFSAGQDLEEVAAPDTDITKHLIDNYEPVMRKLMNLPCPSIAAVNGVAAGAAANIALACDMVIASQKAKFIQPFSKLGLVPDSGGTWTLLHRMGFARAMGHCLTGEPISAEKAEAWGLIWKAVSPDAFDGEVSALAESLAKGPTFGLVATRRAFEAAATSTFTDQLALEAKVQGKCGRTSDYQEGVQAFFRKREPEFTGR
ncbi:MAG: enoyl-CoA hydratase-related protein [Myxococcota bacterium]